ncbi:MAG TPA: hypothetical protein EYO72_06790, partial [Marine Group III euryarchaeote]|nr:hypothetical protein [Marine Group III euryarchaeote]
LYDSDVLYATSYFGGNDPVTDSDGLIPEFLAPIERYNGSSTPAKVITPITVRYVDWVSTFDLDPYQGSSITAFVPDLRVKNNNTGEWSYHIQTSIDNAGTNNLIIVTSGTYYENVVVNKARLTLEAQYEDVVIIDAQDSGCAITISKNSVTIRGFNITNSFEWDDPFNSSGIRVQSDSNVIENNRVTESYVGILLETADSNTIEGNYIDEVDIGILLTKSDSNTIDSNTIHSTDSADIEISSVGYSTGSKLNTIRDNNEIEKIYFKDSDSNKLMDQEVVTVELVYSVRNYAISSEYQYVICDTDSSFYLKNFLDINVSRLDEPLADVDLKVWDGSMIVYSTPFFGGTDSMTTDQGKTPNSILVIYRVYNGSSVGSDNVTQMKVRVGDWFKFEQSLLDEYKTFDFDVPVFRITNQNTAVEYNYIQRAIDNATAGDTIFLSPSEYNEPINITEEITLYGQVGASTIINGDGSTGIIVSEDSVTIKNLEIINANEEFSIGIDVNDSEDTVITNVRFGTSTYGIVATNSWYLIVNNSTFEVNTGIYLSMSSGALIRENVFSNTINGIYDTTENSYSQIINNTFDNCLRGWRSQSSNNIFRDNTLKDTTYGITLISAQAHNNMISNNTFDDSSDGREVYYHIIISQGAHNNSLFNNVFGDSQEFDIWLSGSDDTVSYNNTFSDILVEDANMWVKVYLDLIVYDNSSITFLDADVEVKQDNLVVYSSSYFGGSDPKTSSYGTIETFLINHKEYNGNSTPTIIPTFVTIRNYDWEKTFTSDPSSIIQITVPDFRVQNTRTGTLTYYIQTAIDNALSGDTIRAWSGTYYENIEITEAIILEGNGTSTLITVDVSDSGFGSPPIANSSREGIKITTDGVEVSDLQISNFSLGIKISEADSVLLSNIRIIDVTSHGVDISQSQNVEIVGLHIESSGQSGVYVGDVSSNFEMSDTVVIDVQSNGIEISSENAYIHNVTVLNNDGYGCYVHPDGTGVTISGSTINDNGLNGIKLQAVISATIDNNIIYDNGLTEVYVISSYNVDIYDNNISDSQYGVGIATPGSENIEIYRNEMALSIHLNSSFSKISENNFVDVTGGSVSYDDTAIVISGSYNTISDNTIYNVGVGFVFLYGDYDYNLVENNTLDFTSDDMWYYTSGTNNRFINTDIGIVDIDEDSYFDIRNYVDLEMYTINGPAVGVELNVSYDGGSSIYYTDRYDGSDSTTDSSGTIKRLFIIYQVFDGNFIPDTIETRITYYYDGAEYDITLDTSTSHPEKIWVNLRPVVSIDQINGVGDILATSTEEAIWGADVVMVDSHTIAYWPFNEGSGTTVTDASATYTGTINPTAMWNEGRPNATDDYSVEFDGTFTNIGTNFYLPPLPEFTAEVWFKTDCKECLNQVLFSDKGGLGTNYAYNLYINKDSGVLAFDFKLDTVGLLTLTSTGPQTIVTDNEWHFAVVVRGEDYVELWLDGVKVAEREWSGDIDFISGPCSIG